MKKAKPVGPNEFKIYLSDPQVFSCDTIVIMAKGNTPESFFEKVNEAIENGDFYQYEEKFQNKEEFIKKVKENYVAYYIDGDYDDELPMWYLDSKGIKGAKKVLTFY